MNAHFYNITIRQTEVDGEGLFEARVRELPDVVDFGETWEEAYGLALDTIETTATIMAEQGRRMPAPATVEEDYSGRVTLRLPKSLHRRLAEQAEVEGVSLNHFMVTALAHYCGTGFEAGRKDGGDWRRASKQQSGEQGAGANLQVISSNDAPVDGWRLAG